MGLFDSSSQRRTENREEAEILPVAEVLPQFAPGGYPGLLESMDQLISRVKRAKHPQPELLATLVEDRDRLEAGAPFPPWIGTSPLFILRCPQQSTISPRTPWSASLKVPRVAERARNYQWRLEEDAKTLMESGLLPGELAAFSRTMDDLSHGLSDYPVVFLDTFSSSSYPCVPDRFWT